MPSAAAELRAGFAATAHLEEPLDLRQPCRLLATSWMSTKSST
jgi:hypothetical protein